MSIWGVMPGQYGFLRVEGGLALPELADASVMICGFLSVVVRQGDVSAVGGGFLLFSGLPWVTSLLSWMPI